jgi:hypothetical protein
MWPYLGVVSGLALLMFPAMVPSVWAAVSGTGLTDPDTSVVATQGIARPGNPPGNPVAPPAVRADPPNSGATAPPAALEILTPEMQSVVFRPASMVVEAQLAAIQRRLPTSSRTRRPTDTSVRALGRYLATIGYENGRLPASALRRSTTGCRMYAPAAVAYDAMARAAAEAGFRLEHSGCYRTYQQQVLLRAARCAQGRCRFAAVPGTSLHGWGLAVDFKIGNRALDYRDDLFTWLTQNAGRFGYVHPYWARQGGNLQEPWHWEYGLLTASAAQAALDTSTEITVDVEIGEDKGKLDAALAESGSSTPYEGDLSVDLDPEDPDDDEVNDDPDDRSDDASVTAPNAARTRTGGQTP